MLSPTGSPFPPLQAESAKAYEGRGVGESLLADALNLVLGGEPHPEPYD